MSDDNRLDAIEETLMRMQSELEQLDEAVQAQARAHDALARRAAQLEHRLTQLEPTQDGEEEEENHG
ncbi:MAG: hypothetical protein WD382_02305 [Halofilum sp. (in: g-proteobacteria)]